MQRCLEWSRSCVNASNMLLCFGLIDPCQAALITYSKEMEVAIGKVLISDLRKG